MTTETENVTQMPKKTERRIQEDDARKAMESASDSAKLDFLIANMVTRSDLDKLENRIDSIETRLRSGDISAHVGLEDAQKMLEDFLKSSNKETKAKVAKGLRDAQRADDNFIWRGIHWVDDKTRGFASGTLVVGGSGYLGYKGGKAAWSGVKSLVKLIRGDVAGAVGDGAEAFNQLAS